MAADSTPANDLTQLKHQHSFTWRQSVAENEKTSSQPQVNYHCGTWLKGTKAWPPAFVNERQIQSYTVWCILGVFVAVVGLRKLNLWVPIYDHPGFYLQLKMSSVTTDKSEVTHVAVAGGVK